MILRRPTFIRPLCRAAVQVVRPVRGVLGLAVGILLALYVLAVCTTRGQLTENAAVLGSDSAHADPAWAQNALATIADDRSLFIAMAVVALLGWQQRRLLVGAVAAATMLAANISTQVLKNLVFVRPDLVLDPEVGTGNSRPSGTVTFLLSTALGLVMVLSHSPVAPPLKFILPGVAIAAGCATIGLDWHRPADVQAGVIVVVASFVIARSALARLDGYTTLDQRPMLACLIGGGAVTVLPWVAVALAPVFPGDVTAHGTLVYFVSIVVVAVCSVLTVAPLVSLLGRTAVCTPAERSEVGDDAAEMALQTV